MSSYCSTDYKTIYVLTLSKSFTIETSRTVESAAKLAINNPKVHFVHVIISPACVDKSSLIYFPAFPSNYQLKFFKDSGIGLYHALNSSINSLDADDDSYVIVLSAGDTFHESVDDLYATTLYSPDLIAYSCYIVKGTKKRLYIPRLGLPVLNTFPHPSLLTRLRLIKAYGPLIRRWIEC